MGRTVEMRNVSLKSRRNFGVGFKVIAREVYGQRNCYESQR